MLVTLLAEHWPLSRTYKLDWRSWFLGNSQQKVSSDKQCWFLISVFKFTNIGSNSRVRMPGGSEDKDGGQGRCRYQWYTNTTHWLCLLTVFTDCHNPPTVGLLTDLPLPLHWGDMMVRDHVTRSIQRPNQYTRTGAWQINVGLMLVPKQKSKRTKTCLS